MGKLIILAMLIAVGYFGWQKYQSGMISLPHVSTARSSIPASIAVSNKGDLLKVLGAKTSSVFNTVNGLLSTATGGKSEPVVNQVVGDLQDRVKNLPADEYKKVKYEFCKDVFPTPSPSPLLNQ